jgi:predicted nucleic acid-binding Zn finger protein
LPILRVRKREEKYIPLYIKKNASIIFVALTQRKNYNIIVFCCCCGDYVSSLSFSKAALIGKKQTISAQNAKNLPGQQVQFKTRRGRLA